MTYDLRKLKMVAMATEGKRPKEIAEELGISRQRVLQIALTLTPAHQQLFKPKRAELEMRVCANPKCDKKFFEMPYSKTRYCSRACGTAWHIKYDVPAEFSKTKAEHVKWLYNHYPEYREKRRIMMNKYLKKVMADPKRNARRLKIMRNYARKNKAV